MGRDLHWFVIPKVIVHDPERRMCFGWEFQPDESEVIRDVHGKMGISQDLCDFLNMGRYTDDWCPKCHMFARGIHEKSPLVVAHYHIGHHYTHPGWMSDWNIKSILLGSYHTLFAELFRNDMMYSEIVHKDIDSARFKMRFMKSPPLRTSDKEAKEETDMILDTLEEWSIKGDEYRIIFRNEY